jgi:pimeloyl-ACP methyl ester carboxylesterase
MFMTLYAELSGDHRPDGPPPLVLIHGFGCSGAVWAEVRALLPADYPVIAYDLPGHRFSLDAEGRGGAGRMAKALLADLEHRFSRGFHLAGHSMGGAVAALIAMRASSKVCSLTLIAPGGMGPEINAHALERFACAVNADEIGESCGVMVGGSFEMPHGALNALAADRLQPGALQAIMETYNSMFTEHSSPVKAQGVLPLELLETLKMPVSVLWGEDDAVLPFHQMDRLPDTFRKMHLKAMGHMLPVECPDIVAGVLIETINGPDGA